jgi:Asp/Glu/hydantoin racemase
MVVQYFTVSIPKSLAEALLQIAQKSGRPVDAIVIECLSPPLSQSTKKCPKRCRRKICDN